MPLAPVEGGVYLGRITDVVTPSPVSQSASIQHVGFPSPQDQSQGGGSAGGLGMQPHGQRMADWSFWTGTASRIQVQQPALGPIPLCALDMRVGCDAFRMLPQL